VENVGLFLVPVQHVETLWTQVIPHLLKGEKHWKEFYSIEQIGRNLSLGLQRLWVMLEDNKKILGIVLTQVDQYPETKAVRILYLGGTGFKRSMFEGGLTKLEAWAKKNGATVIDILGRDEWFPLIKEYGYASPGRVYRKEI